MSSFLNCLPTYRAFDWNPAQHVRLKDAHVGSDELSQLVATLWRERRQKPQTYERKLKMKRILETRLFTNYLFTITGSSANGFGFDNCDVDMLVEVCKQGSSREWTLFVTIQAFANVALVVKKNFLFQFKSDILPLAQVPPLAVLRKMKAHLVGVEDFRKPAVIPAIIPLLQFNYCSRRSE